MVYYMFLQIKSVMFKLSRRELHIYFISPVDKFCHYNCLIMAEKCGSSLEYLQYTDSRRAPFSISVTNNVGSNVRTIVNHIFAKKLNSKCIGLSLTTKLYCFAYVFIIKIPPVPNSEPEAGQTLGCFNCQFFHIGFKVIPSLGVKGLVQNGGHPPPPSTHTHTHTHRILLLLV